MEVVEGLVERLYADAGNPTSFEANTLAVWQFCSGTSLVSGTDGEYVLPNVQRPYQWSDAMITGLLRDLHKKFSSNVKKHILQSVTVWRDDSPGKEDELVLLDGQQRLITLYLLLALLRWKGKKDPTTLSNPVEKYLRVCLVYYSTTTTTTTTTTAPLLLVFCILPVSTVSFYQQPSHCTCAGQEPVCVREDWGLVRHDDTAHPSAPARAAAFHQQVYPLQQQRCHG